MTIAEEKQAQRTAAVPPARRWMRRSAPPPMRRCAAGCWNWTLCCRGRTARPFCSTHFHPAFGSEADLLPWLEKASGRAKRWPIRCAARLYPYSSRAGHGRLGDGDSTASARRVLERSALLQPEQLDLVLVPCTAFDADCRRVGMGQGYYDRYLPRCTRAVKIGIALEVQRVPRAAVDAHDQRLDAFVTRRVSTWK